MRIGIFGGSFDPIHGGHLLLAEFCREQARLDRVLFVPAAIPPHKQDHAITPPELRLAMLDLAVGGNPAFAVSKVEIERGGVSYSVDTLTTIRQKHPDDELFFLMGADSLAELPTWREPAHVCELATPLVVRRYGSPEPELARLAPYVSPERVAAIEALQVRMPIIDLSSTELRRRVLAGESIRYQTPRAVEEFILANGLYGASRQTNAGRGKPD